MANEKDNKKIEPAAPAAQAAVAELVANPDAITNDTAAKLADALGALAGQVGPVGRAGMTDEQMHSVSERLKAEAIARVSGNTPGEGPLTKVRVRSARPHYRGGKFWPAASENGPIEAEVSASALKLLQADPELVVETSSVPTLDEVLAAGYSPEAARDIVERETAKAAGKATAR
jgi:hypothetical protein